MTEYLSLSKKEVKVLKGNVASGLFDGTLFGICWGCLYGPATLYTQGIDRDIYKKAVIKYMGKSIKKGAPLVMMSRIVGDICESKQVGSVTQFSITFAFAIAYLALVKFP